MSKLTKERLCKELEVHSTGDPEHPVDRLRMALSLFRRLEGVEPSVWEDAAADLRGIDQLGLAEEVVSMSPHHD